MGTFHLLKLDKSSKIYDPIRKKWVVDSPEERVRQALIKKLIEELGFEKSLIAIEKELDIFSFPEAKTKAKRRADIICFAKNIHPNYPLYPLLMIECKAVPLTHKVIEQVAGYNHFISACFIAVANEQEVKMLWYEKDKKEYQSIDFIPSYQQLLATLRTLN